MAGLVAAFVFLVGLWVRSAFGHVVITYPGWRGNNLITNPTFPYGMQFSYPCGGLGPTNNRTAWPISGGAVSFQPGWLPGHSTALLFINLGLGEQPPHYSIPMKSVFEIRGPTNNPYPHDNFCLPMVSPPAGLSLKEGDLASIQIVQVAKHGATLFSCADIIFTNDMSKVPRVDGSNCFNSSDIGVGEVHTVFQSGNSSAGGGNDGVLGDENPDLSGLFPREVPVES